MSGTHQILVTFERRAKTSKELTLSPEVSVFDAGAQDFVYIHGL